MTFLRSLRQTSDFRPDECYCIDNNQTSFLVPCKIKRYIRRSYHVVSLGYCADNGQSIIPGAHSLEPSPRRPSARSCSQMQCIHESFKGNPLSEPIGARRSVHQLQLHCTCSRSKGNHSAEPIASSCRARASIPRATIRSSPLEYQKLSVRSSCHACFRATRTLILYSPLQKKQVTLDSCCSACTGVPRASTFVNPLKNR